MKHLHLEAVKVVNTRNQVLMAAAGFLAEGDNVPGKAISPLPAHQDSSQFMACLLDSGNVRPVVDVCAFSGRLLNDFMSLRKNERPRHRNIIKSLM